MISAKDVREEMRKRFYARLAERPSWYQRHKDDITLIIIMSLMGAALAMYITLVVQL